MTPLLGALSPSPNASLASHVRRCLATGQILPPGKYTYISVKVQKDAERTIAMSHRSIRYQALTYDSYMEELRQRWIESAS